MAYSSEDFFSNYRKTFVIAPFKPSQVTPLGYDLRLGFMVNADSDKTLSPSNQTGIENKSSFIIKPNQSVIAIPVERIYLSGKVLATVHARARLSIRGIILSAVTVDPNFGEPNFKMPPIPGSRLLLRLKNTSKHSVMLTTEDDSIATLIVHEVQSETNRRPLSGGIKDLLESLKKDDPRAVPTSSAKAIIDFIDNRSYTTTTTKDGDKELDKTEKEFRSAAEDMIHYRNILRTRERSN